MKYDRETSNIKEKDKTRGELLVELKNERLQSKGQIYKRAASNIRE